MAVKTLNTLVQRGVRVLEDKVTVETRRGLGYRGLGQPLAPISMRSPMPVSPSLNPDRRQDREQDQLADPAAKRAGRLERQAGSPQQRSCPSHAVRAVQPSWPWFTARRRSASMRGSDVQSLGLARTAG